MKEFLMIIIISVIITGLLYSCAATAIVVSVASSIVQEQK